jgi:ABC-2 type transport system ATP-binding protein
MSEDKIGKGDAEKSVIVEHLVKNFDVTQKEKGLVGNITSIFSPKRKTIRALKNVSFTLEKGEIVGFIGPNGAGKTTTLKILSGLLYPTAGFIQVLGYNPWDRKAEFLKQISVVFGQKNQLWWDLPAIDTFELNKTIYEIPENKYKEILNELVDILEVKKLLNIQVRRLSLGQRMRLELIASLLHEPEILFLDEPTIGLDVVAQANMRDFIFEYQKKHNATIMLTSHNMDDVMDLTKRVIVIDKGNVLFDGKIRELIGSFAREKIIKAILSKESDIKKLEHIGKIKRLDYPEVTISVPREAVAVAAAELLQNIPIADLEIEEEPIEDIIRRVFKGELVKK